jgi:hypothetical protein
MRSSVGSNPACGFNIRQFICSMAKHCDFAKEPKTVGLTKNLKMGSWHIEDM